MLYDFLQKAFSDWLKERSTVCHKSLCLSSKTAINNKPSLIERKDLPLFVTNHNVFK